MFLRCVCVFLLLATGARAESAVSGRVLKVLPLFLDLQGRTSPSPSLLDRDAYQAQLRSNPKLCSGIEFAINWRAKGPKDTPLTLRIELRGGQPGQLPTRAVLEQAVTPKGGLFGAWTSLKLLGAEHRRVGDVTSWRATLWQGASLLGEQQSFLWESRLPDAPFTNAPAAPPAAQPATR
jgi:hypothetical protein